MKSKTCPNCNNEHNGPWSRCDYCYSVAVPTKGQRDISTDEAIEEYRHDQSEQSDGGWIT